MWQELIRPLILLEYVSDNRGVERDRTPLTGKFWVYEQAISAPYYGIFDAAQDSLELYRLIDGSYELQAPNAQGRYPIPPLGVELGIWHGTFFNIDTAWLRWWDNKGMLLPTSAEREQADPYAWRRLNYKRRPRNSGRRLKLSGPMSNAWRRKNVMEKLRSLGIDPDTI